MMQCSFMRSISSHCLGCGCRYPDHTSSLEDSNDLEVAHVLAPHAFLANSWPLRSVAVSSDALDVAVAGKQGLALYDRRARKWRLFGDVGQERAFRVLHLGWLQNVVVATIVANPGASAQQSGEDGASVAANEAYSLVLYSRYALEQQSILARRSLPEVCDRFVHCKVIQSIAETVINAYPRSLSVCHHNR